MPLDVFGWLRRDEERVLACELTAAGTLLVRDGARYRELVEIGEREMVHTRVERSAPLRSGFPYTDAMHAARWLASPEPRTALCLGVGGGIVAQQLVAMGLDVDAVDSSATVLALAETYFALRPSRALTIVRADAGDFVERAHACHYDVALIDLFGPFEASPLLARPAFFESVRRALAPGAAVAVNLVGSLDGSGGAMKLALFALAEVFAEVIVLPMLTADERRTGLSRHRAARNVIAFAKDGEPTHRLADRPVPPELPHLPDALLDLDERLRQLAGARSDATEARGVRLGA